MKTVLKTIIYAVLFMATSVVLQAQNHNNHNNNNDLGSWRVLGTMQATHNGDHDALEITGKHDSFRKLKIKVRNSPVNIERMLVRYEDGKPEEINTRNEIPKDGESRVIDLKGGKRKLKAIEFWYDTKGFLNGKAELTILGMK